MLKKMDTNMLAEMLADLILIKSKNNIIKKTPEIIFGVYFFILLNKNIIFAIWMIMLG